jgi:hypothetical protein
VQTVIIFFLIVTAVIVLIAFQLLYLKIKGRMPFNVAGLDFDDAELRDFQSFWFALQTKLPNGEDYIWIAAHSAELLRRLAEDDYSAVLVGFCTRDATTKLVFEAVQSAGNTTVFKELLKTVSSSDMLNHLESKLPSVDLVLKSQLAELIDFRRKEISAPLQEVPSLPISRIPNSFGDGPNPQKAL